MKRRFMLRQGDLCTMMHPRTSSRVADTDILSHFEYNRPRSYLAFLLEFLGVAYDGKVIRVSVENRRWALWSQVWFCPLTLTYILKDSSPFFLWLAPPARHTR